jgi:SOS-response transcriptional repressor LexA
MSFPKRLHLARRKKQLTQQQLAEQLGISVQAISQWENGQSKPTLDRAFMLAALLSVDPEWLQGKGPDEPIQQRKQEFSVNHAENAVFVLDRNLIGYWVDKFPDLNIEPILLLPDVVTLDVVLGSSDQIEKSSDIVSLRPTFPPKGFLFAIDIVSESMTPTFNIGDHVFIDAGVKAEPGDYVAAKLEGELRATFRRYRPRGTDKNGVEQYELAPLNPDYPTISVNSAHPGRIIGTMVEHRTYRRRKQRSA